jgi:hypothetical protein
MHSPLARGSDRAPPAIVVGVRMFHPRRARPGKPGSVVIVLATWQTIMIKDCLEQPRAKLKYPSAAAAAAAAAAAVAAAQTLLLGALCPLMGVLCLGMLWHYNVLWGPLAYVPQLSKLHHVCVPGNRWNPPTTAVSVCCQQHLNLQAIQFRHVHIAPSECATRTFLLPSCRPAHASRSSSAASTSSYDRCISSNCIHVYLHAITDVSPSLCARIGHTVP